MELRHYNSALFEWGIGTPVCAVCERIYSISGAEQVVDRRCAGGSGRPRHEKRRRIKAVRYDRVKARFSTGPDSAALT